MTKKTNWLKDNWKSLLLVAIAIIALIAFWPRKTEAPEVVHVPEITTQALQQAMPDLSKSEVKDTAHQIQRAKETQAPQYHYYTYTQAAADKQAQEYAEKDKADKLVKETKEVEVKNEETGETSKVIENDYYAINLERKHRIKAGAAMIDKTAYISLGYQNRDVEYKIYYAPEKKEVGAGIEVTIAKW
jgi:hypothetical protein